jgi:hypothetical protein
MLLVVTGLVAHDRHPAEWNDERMGECGMRTREGPSVPGAWALHGRSNNPMECFATMQTANGGRVGPVPILIGTYTSESVMDNDLSRLGAYAKGNDGTEYVAFASLPTSALAAESAMFQPLRAYGFETSPSSNPSVEPTQSPPGNTNAIPAPTAVPPPSDNSRQIPPDADRQGFLSYPGARCNYTNPAVVIARTADSALVICETGAGRFYYRGVGLQNGLSVEIDDPVQSGAGFVVTNNGVRYSVSQGALLITQGASVLSNEPMLEYWSG